MQNVLEVGRSSGYLLEAINDLGYTAIGLTTPFDVLAQGPLEKSHGVALPRDFGFGGGSFDLVVLLDTLEHLAPAVIPTVLAELQRSCDGFIYVTISSFGLDDVGDDGWFVGKVKE